MSLTLKLALSPLLVAQALATRRRLPRLPEPEGERAGVAGRGGVLLRLLLAGDSSAAGVGVATQREALAGRVAETLATACRAQVHWRLLARSGLTTAQTLALLRRHEQDRPQDLQADVAVVVTGVNDVVEQVPSHHAVRVREALADWLRNAHGVQHVVFTPLPPVHQFPGLPQPLRWIAGSDARRHDAALRRWAASRGDVSYAPMELPLNRGVMAEDGFHPGAPLYRITAAALAEHIAAQVWPRLDLAR